MGILDCKVCVITGCAGSLGLASALVLQHEGAKTMLVDLDDTDLRRALATLDPNKTAMTVADVTQANQVQDYLDRTVRKWGKIDVLFSNAGISGVVAPVTDYPDEMFDQVIAVHVRGAFLACKYGLPHMKDGGSIIITSSVVGVRGGGGGTV